MAVYFKHVRSFNVLLSSCALREVRMVYYIYGIVFQLPDLLEA